MLIDMILINFVPFLVMIIMVLIIISRLVEWSKNSMIEFSEENIHKVLDILNRCWSIKSSSKWTINNPANGQCSVTSLVINGIFGGYIVKTKVSEGWHFYNKIGSQTFDFTKSQFLQEPIYEDVLSSREEAFNDTNKDQYNYLKMKVSELVELDYRENV